MANLTTQGIAPRPHGKHGRKIVLPVKAAVQIREGALVAQIAGACVPFTTALAGDAIGVAMHDQLGGATDGATRIEVLTEQEFNFAAGVAAPTDATPIGTLLYGEDDHTVGTGGLGATQRVAGTFRGIEDDGSVRLFVNPDLDTSTYAGSVAGAALTDSAAQTVQRAGRVTTFRQAALSQNSTVTLGTTGAVAGDVARVIRTTTAAFTTAVVNGGAGAGTLATLVASKPGFVEAIFDGTNWLYLGSSAT